MKKLTLLALHLSFFLLNIDLVEAQAYSPFQDTVNVCGNSATLDAGAGFNNYSWSNGSTSQQISINESGIYRVTVQQGVSNINTSYFDLTDRYVRVPSAPQLSFGNQMTIMLKTRIVGPFPRGLPTLMDQVSTNGMQLTLDGTNAKLNFRYNGVDNGNGVSYTLTSQQVQNSTWFYIAIKKSEDSLFFFVNGQIVDQIRCLNPIPNIGSPFNFGGGGGYFGNYRGSIDNISFWNRGLSNNEISRYGTCMSGLENGCVGYYNFDGSNSMQDFSIYGNFAQHNSSNFLYAYPIAERITCSISTLTDSTYINLSSASIAQNDTTICSGTTLTLNATSTNNFSSSALPSNLQNGLVGYWPFNGNANDESGNGNNGTVNGVILANDRFGNTNQSFLFNGNQNNITIPTLHQNNILEYSVSGWFKIDSAAFGTGGGTVFAGNTPLASNSGLRLALSGNRLPAECGLVHNLQWNVEEGSNTNGILGIDLNTIYNDNQWHHFVSTFSSNTGLINASAFKIYIDGSMISSESFQQHWPPGSGFSMGFNVNAPISNSNLPVILGNHNGLNNGFQGNLDDIFIYHRALSASEVQQLYSLPPTYLWSTGDTTASITVSPTETTTYYVTVNNGTSSCTDSVTVTVNSNNIFLQDTIRHCGASYSLTPGAGYSSYSWSTGQTTASINATTSKWYRCTVTSNGCSSTDSVYLQITNPLSIPVPASITIQAIQTNVCGARRYRYIAPILPANATGYQWSFVGSLYNGSGTIDSGTLTSRIITVTYSSNAASAAGDSVKLRYNTICGYGNWRALKLSNLALLPPAAPTTITVQAVSQNNCGARRYRYIAPALPVATATTAAATGWQWELAGSLAEFATIDSGDENSQKIVVVYSVNSAAQAGDSIKLFYQSNCGNGKTRAIKMTNLKLNPPVIPACITIQPVATNICGARRYRYLAHNLPNATTTSGAATGWQWTMPTGNLGLSATLDSGTLTSKVIIIRYSSNAAAGVGDSIKIRYNSDCGYSPYRAVRLTNTLLNPPVAPASITMTLVQNDCGARIYRYTAPVLPSATTANGAANGYAWSMPFGPLGSQGTLDSGTLTGRSIRILYPSNDASQSGDSIRVRYNSVCGFGLNRTMKLSNTAKTGCPPITKPAVPYSKNAEVKMDEQNLSVLVYPNPSAQQFRLKISSQSLSMVRVGLFDMQGKRISQMQLSANSVIDFGNDLKPGVYHLEVVQDKERQAVRIVKY
jgi:hypothetical protein